MITPAQMTTTLGKDQFYPTPDALAGDMLAGLDWSLIDTVLDPSAGKGNLVECAARAKKSDLGYGCRPLDADCIEIDPYLRQILAYNFSQERFRSIMEPAKAIERKPYNERTNAEQRTLKRLERERDILKSVNLHIVHDDFLTFRGDKRYDLILMNPPFADGDLHLLKALEIQKYGGSIVCLLNAETLRNPYSAKRELLQRELDRLGADITFLDGAFLDAERHTAVPVAIVRVHIPCDARESTFYERMKKAVEQEQHDQQVEDLVAGDYPEQGVQLYDVEVAATLDFIREYEALKPYMAREAENCRDPILRLVVGVDSPYDVFDINRYLRTVRLKYWRALFRNEQFTGKLTSNLRDQYMNTVDKMADYDFSLFNIRQVLAEMNADMIDGLKATILELFDKLTDEHSWYPECKKNRHYFNGWATNKAHKIGQKSIIPTYGMFSTYSWSESTFEVSNAYKVISDIEKIFNYLDGGMTQEVDLLSRLQLANAEGRTRNIECKYFKIDLYKKGTTHIKFANMDLVDKLNIYAAKNKNWLPPNYGKVRYGDMALEEQAVVDEFQGEDAYNRVLDRRDYFLSESVNTPPMIAGAS